MPNREPSTGDASVSTFPTRSVRLKSDAMSPDYRRKSRHFGQTEGRQKLRLHLIGEGVDSADP
jgi:hypothetical protein